MKLAVIGSTGRVGSRIVIEAKERGHEIINIPRDLFSLTKEDLSGVDALISAFGTWTEHDLHLKAAKYLDALLAQIDIPWYVVGGAGSLLVAENTPLYTTENFPSAYYPTAEAMKHGLDYLQSEAASKWSYFSPAAAFEPGDKVGAYTFGGDYLLRDENGDSYITMEDYAAAMIDAVEGHKFIKERFTAVQKVS